MRIGLFYVVLLLGLALAPVGFAAPYAAMVMDARTGEVLYETNADTRLHPASLTKMLTLYIAFEAIRKGEISLDTQVKISANAANEAPSKLGLKAGQRIALRYLIRAAAVKSANDCATAIGEAISGTEEAFAKRMNRTAKALGMRQSTFRNANGLTAEGHLSTAHDMTILGRRLFYDFPEYYNIFSRRTTDAGLATVNNTNTRFLDAYRGADGIKTGYTGPAGFNLVASAERGSVRIIATVFGGTSTAQRNAKVAELLDLGFDKADPNAKARKPAAPSYADTEEPALIAANPPQPGDIDEDNGVGKTIRISGAVQTSQRPRPRPGTKGVEPDPALLVAMQDDIASALATTVASAEAAPVTEAIAEATADPTADAASDGTVALAAAGPPPAPDAAPDVAAAPQPEPLPFQLVSEIPDGATPALTEPADPAATETVAMANAAKAPTPPKARPAMVVLASAVSDAAAPEEEPEVVTRLSTSDGRVWGVTLGKFASPGEAERVLMKTALAESGTLADALRKVVKRKTGFEAHFAGMSQDQADLACRRLQARAIECFTLGP